MGSELRGETDALPPPKRILIIDDETAIQSVVQFGIQMIAGWEVLTAGSGAQGIQIAQREPLDAILLDLNLPDMDGRAIAQALQSQATTATIPIIFLTAEPVDLRPSKGSDPDLGQACDGRGIITKPFNALQLPAQIARILQWSLVDENSVG
jgi:DNA-binding response OmpR family regulator